MLTTDNNIVLDCVMTHPDVLACISELARERRIVGPVAHGDHYLYQEVKAPQELDLSFNYSVQSPKSFLLPPTETLLTFDSEKGGFVAKPVVDQRSLAIVGVHPCDVHAIRLLDRVFSKDYFDPHYNSRRANTFIIAIDCSKPCTPGAFCGDMHANSAVEGFDLNLYPIGGSSSVTRYGVAIGTHAGRDLVREAGNAKPPTQGDVRLFEKYLSQKSGAFPAQLRTRMEDLPDLVNRSYDSPLWEAMSRHCYSCGSCNLVCPTCYCFNILDDLEMDGHRGQRKREWDGCMLPDFAVVAGGHNFRSKTAHRLRHRVFRKVAWIEEQTGLPGCTGCGRCDRACTAKISLVEMLNQLAGEHSDDR